MTSPAWSMPSPPPLCRRGIPSWSRDGTRSGKVVLRAEGGFDEQMGAVPVFEIKFASQAA
jgi:hypothetical protein